MDSAFDWINSTTVAWNVSWGGASLADSSTIVVGRWDGLGWRLALATISGLRRAGSRHAPVGNRTSGRSARNKERTKDARVRHFVPVVARWHPTVTVALDIVAGPSVKHDRDVGRHLGR